MQAQTNAHRVLLAMTSPEERTGSFMLNNIRNLIAGMAPEPVEVEVVAYGPGIAFLKKNDVDAAAIQRLESPHVHFVACGNAMREQHLEASDLIAGSEVCPRRCRRDCKETGTGLKLHQGWSLIAEHSFQSSCECMVRPRDCKG